MQRIIYDRILFIAALDDIKVSVMKPAGQNWKWLTPGMQSITYIFIFFIINKNIVLKIKIKKVLINNRCHYKFTAKY